PALAQNYTLSLHDALPIYPCDNRLSSDTSSGCPASHSEERMSQQQWTTVDDYYSDLLVPTDPVLDAVLAASEAGGLPAHNVAPRSEEHTSELQSRENLVCR